MNNKVFKIVSFSPIGFKKNNYPVPYCSYCRGYLDNVCYKCIEQKCEICKVANKNETYYHIHCANLASKD